jgi:hypothetical protein
VLSPIWSSLLATRLPEARHLDPALTGTVTGHDTSGGAPRSPRKEGRHDGLRTEPFGAEVCRTGLTGNKARVLGQAKLVGQEEPEEA